MMDQKSLCRVFGDKRGVVGGRSTDQNFEDFITRVHITSLNTHIESKIVFE